MTGGESTSRNTIARALESRGTSGSAALYALTRDLVLQQRGCAVLVDVGCGTGTLYQVLKGCYTRYVGIDVVRYEGFPSASDAEFRLLSLDDRAASLPEHLADVVCCLETVEHLENPRQLARDISRILKPGGLAIVSTPNQLSLLSKVCLLLKNEFVHFQERPGLYPSHLSALLECDLRRIATEVDWESIGITYTAEGRIPGTTKHWPPWLSATSGWRGRAFSDNVILTARSPVAPRASE